MTAVCLGVTVVGVAVCALVGDSLTSSMKKSTDAATVSGAIERLYSTFLEAENGQRGFLLTGNESYLESFGRMEASLTENFNHLAPLVARDNGMQSQLLELRGLTEVKMAGMRDSIKMRREKGLAAVESANASKGTPMTDRIHDLIAQMDQKQLDIVSTAGQANQRLVVWTRLTGLFTGFLGIGAGLFALYLVRLGSAQEQVRRELLEEKLRAEKSVVEKSAFLANISHEIRTPMNAILGFGELLEGEPLTPGQTQYVKSIRQSGKSLLQLINDVLDLSKLEAGKLDIHHEPTDITEICNFLKTMFGQQAGSKSLELKFETSGVPNALLLDRLRLRQVLVNLVGNAVKFTTQGHVLTRAKWLHEAGDGSRGTLTICVEDTGIGISPEKRDEIFKPFVQSDSLSTQENEGTGLGLHIVQRLTQIMGGSVTLESTPGKGSVFHLRFPEVSVSARLPVNDGADMEGAVDFNDFARATLLVVDDNETNRNLITGIFERTHHQIRLACDGREALASVAETRPGLVLLDIRMPVMDGHEVLAEIRKTPGLELLPVIAVTASSQDGDERDLRTRFNGYVRKPFTRQELYRELAQFLPRSLAKDDRDKGTPGKSGAAPSGCTARKAENWDLMLAELRVLQASLWVGLQESIAINETKAFARKLHAIAEPNQCAPLTAYSELLAAHAQNYSVRDLEKLLAEFPTLLQTIEQHSTQTSNG